MTHAEHARRLAAEHDIDLLELPGMKPEDSCANTALRMVACAPIFEETTYAVALHEMGHVAVQGTASRVVEVLMAFMAGRAKTARRALADEDEAWAWARAHAMEWTDVMQSVMDWSRGTYARGLEKEERCSGR